MNNPSPTPYPELNTVLAELVTSVQDILVDNFIGAYLQGSFAVGDFDLDSDCDFIIVTQDDLTTGEVAALQIMHKRIFSLEREWAQHLEGSYFPQRLLKSHDDCTDDLWFLDHGSSFLAPSTHCNTILVRWILRECGVTLSGPPPSTLIDPIPTEALRAESYAALVERSNEVLANPESVDTRWYQGYIVLNHSRILHDLVEGFPGSKRAGAEWAKATFDPSWTPLIDRAWSCRLKADEPWRQPADPEDTKSTLEYVQLILDRANAEYAVLKGQ